jgi:hypothetical protein
MDLVERGWGGMDRIGLPQDRDQQRKFLFSPIHTIFPAHLILLDLIIISIHGEEYRSWS